MTNYFFGMTIVMLSMSRVKAVTIKQDPYMLFDISLRFYRKMLTVRQSSLLFIYTLSI
jgi:energy-converting hydrogenase Eha subunit F